MTGEKTDERERYRKALLFDRPDRVPLEPGAPRESTLETWYEQGLPRGVVWHEHLMDEIGVDTEGKLSTQERFDPGVSFKMIPPFEEEVLEHRNGHYMVRDWTGAVVEISDEYDYTYLRWARDFVTRKWHRFPVESRGDWEKLRWRYDPEDPERFPDDFEERCRRLGERDYPVSFKFNGPFWQLREWLGLENLCLKFALEPGFVREMIDFWTGFVSGTMAPVLERVEVDRVCIGEDMAYKAHSMISPDMVRSFLMPAYERWVGEIRASGCPVIDMDSDGYIGELLPIWIESGINCTSPVEVAAGNDIVAYRERYGREMAFRGGIDKRALAAGGERAYGEVMRVVPPLLEQGGFIPGCDHGVPADVSWPDFVEYARLVAELTGWL